MFFKLFMWSRVAILIEETKMSISDMTISTGHAQPALTNLTKRNCACGIGTGTPSNCGNFTVVCADTTVVDVTCLSEATERLTDCTCETLLHSTTGTSTTLSKHTRLRACGCRDNPQQRMAPRRRGSRVPSLFTVGSLGPRPFSYAAVHAGSRVLLLAV